MRNPIPCPDEETLLAFAEGVASGLSAAATERHLDECAGCRMVVSAAATDDDVLEPPPTGTTVGRYLLEQRIGSGTMGVVYRASDPVLSRLVAVKVLNAQWARRPAARLRLAREARALAQLSDANVLQIYDVGGYRGGLFIAMEFVEGVTLDQWCVGRSPREIVAMYIQTGLGLAAAHRAKLIHRDFKPSNVLIGRDQRPRVADFGLVSTADDRSTTGDDNAEPEGSVRLTHAGSLVGTPRYMSPEQLRGEMAQTGSDQFAYCVALYEALYGAPPFPGTTPHALRAAIPRGPTVPEKPGSRRLFSLLRKGLRADPSQRHAGMSPLVAALARTQRRPTRRVVGFVAAAAVSTAAALAFSSTGDSCDRTESYLLDSQRLVLARLDEKLRHADAGDLAAEVGREVSAYSSAWSKVFTPLCHLERHSTAVTSPSLECLETRRIDFEQSLSMIVQHDMSARQALSVLDEIGDPRSCIDAPADQYPSPALPGLSARIRFGRETLSSAHILHSAGKTWEARAELEAAWDSLMSLPVPSLQVRAKLLRGTLQVDTDQPTEGIATLSDAFSEAMRHGLQTTALRIVTRLMLAHVKELQDVDGALRWDEQANALVNRTHSRLAQAEYFKEHARILFAQRKLDEALQAAERGLQLATSADLDASQVRLAFDAMIGGICLHQQDTKKARFHYERLANGYATSLGAQHPNLASAYLGLGQVALAEADYEESELLVDLAEEIMLLEFDPQSWQIGTVIRTRASLETARGNIQAALEHQERLLIIEESEATPSDRRLRSSLRTMSLTLERAGDHIGSLALRERVLVLAESADGPDSYDAALSQNNVAAARLRLGRLDEAQLGFERSLVTLEGLQGPDASICAYPLSGLGETHLERGSVAKAIPLLERALVLAPRGTAEWATTATVLARALWAPGAHRNTERALTLATQAEQVLSESPAYVHEHEQVSSWLESL